MGGDSGAGRKAAPVFRPRPLRPYAPLRLRSERKRCPRGIPSHIVRGHLSNEYPSREIDISASLHVWEENDTIYKIGEFPGGKER